MKLFKSRYGIIVACDAVDIGVLRRVIEGTRDVEGVEGYKIGAMLALRYGLFRICEEITAYTELPIIYDHQKLGTDIPEICGGGLLEVCEEAGIRAVIIFPQSGLETLRATVKGCLRLGLIPIVGGEMTHPRYLQSEGGYIADDAPERIYLDAARLGVEYFVVPGTKVERMRKYRLLLEREVGEPKFLFPGIGEQGGDITRAFEAVHPFSSYAIVGRAIYTARDIRGVAERLSRVIKSISST
ncbi:MAG: orotidine 5'-phosphate decarboxylase / HUMPS family protein [Candidatus Methanospirareceae archaeon]